ncbi:MAG TPA: hypothetical protein PKY30_22745, partial [Myxococcota bacterium]|nr:hypothetical protein [Myxococcota bacterium]
KAFQAAGFPGPSAFAARLSVEADAVWQQLPWAFLADGPQFLREFGWTFEIAAPSGDAQRLPSPFHLLILVPEESEQENAPIGAHLHVEQLRHLLEGTWKQPQSPHVVVVHGREQLAEVLPKQSFHALYVYSRAVHRRGEILLDLGGRNYAIRDLQKDVPGLLLAYLNLLLPGDWAPPPFPGPCVVLPPPGLDPAAAADLALNWWRELVEGHRDPLVATASLPSAGAWRTRLVCPWMWWETQMSLGARLHHLALQHVDRHVQRGATAEAVEHFKTAPNARAQLLVGFGNEADHVEALSSQLVAHIRPANKSWYSLDTIDVPFPEQATPAHLRAALLERLQAAEVVAGLEARKKLIDPRDRRPRIVEAVESAPLADRRRRVAHRVGHRRHAPRVDEVERQHPRSERP